jgi:hypothetical protein
MQKVNQKLITILLLTICVSPVIAQEMPALKTLFTTPQERQVINRNRYKTDEPTKQVAPAPKVEQQTEAVRDLVQEEVNVTYQISGVTTNTEGSKTAWINGKAYRSGDTMDDGSKISISNTSVIITTVDGKSYRGVGGEVLNLTFTRTRSD